MTDTVNPATGEVTTNLGLEDRIYSQISQSAVTAEQKQALLEPVTYDEVEVKPDSFGAVYLSHAGYRRRLNDAFGPRGWAMRRLSDVQQQDGLMYQEWALYAEGQFCASATGEHDASDGGMSFGDSLEAIKSDALKRCCKDLGMALDLWNKAWVEKFRQAMCFKVLVQRRDGKVKPAWRRIDVPKLYGEIGLSDDSPNRDKYDPDERGPSKPSAPESAAPPPSGKVLPHKPNGGGAKVGRTITDKQLGYLAKKLKLADLDPKEFDEWLFPTYNIKTRSELKMDDFDGVLATIDKIANDDSTYPS